MFRGVGGSLSCDLREEERKKKIENNSERLKGDFSMQGLFNPVIVEGCSASASNYVWMNIKDVQKLFNLKTISNSHYVRIADYVHKVVVNRGGDSGYIGISNLECYNICSLNQENSYGDFSSKLLVSSFCPFPQSEHDLFSIEFEISEHHLILRELNPKSVISLNLHNLRHYIQKMYADQYLACKQTVMLEYDKHRLFLTVNSMGYQKKSISKHSVSKFYGSIRPQTKIFFKIKDKSKIIMLKPVFSKHIERLKCSISFVQDSEKSMWKGDLNKPLPWIVDEEDIVEKIKKCIKNREFVVGDTFECMLDKTRRIKGSLEDVVLKTSFSGARSKHDFIYVISATPSIEIASLEGVICTNKKKDIEKNAQKMIFEVVDKRFNRKQLFLKNHKVLIDVGELRQKIIENSSTFIQGQRVIIKLSKGLFCLEMIEAMFEKNDSEFRLSEFLDWGKSYSKTSNIWKIVENTEIVFKTHLEAISLVENSSNIPSIQALKVSVWLARPLPFFFKPLIESSILSVKLSDLRNLRHKFPDVVQLNQQLNLTIDEDQELICKIQEMEFKEKIEENPNYHVLARISENTKIEFVSEPESGVNIIKGEIPEIGIKKVQKECDIEKELNSFGLGGFSEAFISSLRQFIVPRLFRSEAIRRGIKPIQGLLLYGAPGTGKTTLAWALGKMLGCLDCNIKIIAGPEVLSKWLGESEKNLRELFDKAKKDFESFGEKSPLHYLIFDEIESILPKRTDKERDGVVAQFLALFGGFNQLTNVVVVGVTNRKEAMDSAVLRPDRLEFHLEMPMPGRKERAQIFAIHLKTMIEASLLSKKVSLETLAVKTSGFTGADIKGLVRRAIGFAIERLSNLNLSKEEIENHPAGITTVEDFDRALKEVTEKRDDRMSEAVSLMYI